MEAEELMRLHAPGIEPDANATAEDETTALIRAAAKNSFAAIRQLLRGGANVHAENSQTGETATAVTCRLGNVEALEALHEGGANLASCTQDGRSATMVAAGADQWGILEKLCDLFTQAGVRKEDWVDQQAPDGATALHYAARSQALSALRFLLRLRPAVDSKDHAGLTPLHTAALRGHTDACTMLLKGGSRFVDEALSVAAACNHSQLAYVLVEERAAQDRNGTVLLKAIQADDGNLCWALACRGASPTHLPLPSGMGMPVHCAAQRNCWWALEGLLQGGAGIDQRDPLDGATVLHRAVEAKDLELVSYLLFKGAGVNAQTHDGDTPLHRAALQAQWGIIVELLEAGADFFLQNQGGAQPIDLVAERGQVAMCSCGAVCECERACFSVLHFVQLGKP